MNYMILKELLKPNKKNIALFMLLIIILSPKPCGNGALTTPPECSCYGILDTSPPPGMWDFSYVYRCYGICDITCSYFKQVSSDLILSYILELMIIYWIKTILIMLISYIISCLIVWIYNKKFTKKK